MLPHLVWTVCLHRPCFPASSPGRRPPAEVGKSMTSCLLRLGCLSGSRCIGRVGTDLGLLLKEPSGPHTWGHLCGFSNDFGHSLPPQLQVLLHSQHLLGLRGVPSQWFLCLSPLLRGHWEPLVVPLRRVSRLGCQAKQGSLRGETLPGVKVRLQLLT